MILGETEPDVPLQTLPAIQLPGKRAAAWSADNQVGSFAKIPTVQSAIPDYRLDVLPVRKVIQLFYSVSAQQEQEFFIRTRLDASFMKHRAAQLILPGLGRPLLSPESRLSLGGG
jgi:hypothetical protein